MSNLVRTQIKFIIGELLSFKLNGYALRMNLRLLHKNMHHRQILGKMFFCVVEVFEYFYFLTVCYQGNRPDRFAADANKLLQQTTVQYSKSFNKFSLVLICIIMYC